MILEKSTINSRARLAEKLMALESEATYFGGVGQDYFFEGLSLMTDNPPENTGIRIKAQEFVKRVIWRVRTANPDMSIQNLDRLYALANKPKGTRTAYIQCRCYMRIPLHKAVRIVVCPGVHQAIGLNPDLL